MNDECKVTTLNHNNRVRYKFAIRHALHKFISAKLKQLPNKRG